MNLDTLTTKAKAVAALIGSVATALLAIYGPDTQVGHVLTVVVAIVTAVATYAVPNTAGASKAPQRVDDEA